MNTLLVWSGAALAVAPPDYARQIYFATSLVGEIWHDTVCILIRIALIGIPIGVILGLLYLIYGVLVFAYRFLTGFVSGFVESITSPAPDPYRQMDALSDAYLNAVAHRLTRR